MKEIELVMNYIIKADVFLHLLFSAIGKYLILASAPKAAQAFEENVLAALPFPFQKPFLPQRLGYSHRYFLHVDDEKYHHAFFEKV